MIKKLNSSRLTILSAIAAMSAVLATSLTHVTNGINFFIATEISYDIVRVGVLAILVSLLFIKAPRSMAMRIFLGIIAAVVFISSTWMLLNYQMQMIDTFVFIISAIVFAIEALEPELGPRVVLNSQTD